MPNVGLHCRDGMGSFRGARHSGLEPVDRHGNAVHANHDEATYTSSTNGQELFFLYNAVNDLGSVTGGSGNSFYVTDPNSYESFPAVPYVLAPLAATTTPYFDDGNVHTATINYVVPSNCAPSCPLPTLTIMIDATTVLTTNVDIASLLGLDPTGDAWVGFTSATGASWEEHDIVNWNFSSSAVQGTTLPPTPVSPSSATVTAIFNSATNNLVQHVLDFSASTVTFQANTEMINSNQAIAPADWVKYVANSPLATTSCIPHNGEGGNCKLYIDLCTSEGNPTPAGINCPQSSADNIVIQDTFDATPKPTTAPGTGFGFLMGGDGWSTQGQASCIFGGPLTGTSCPQDILVSFTGDTNSSAGRTKSLNSTFVTVSGVLMPSTFPSVSPTNSYGWTNTPTPTLSFASYPPGIGSGTPVPARWPRQSCERLHSRAHREHRLQREWSGHSAQPDSELSVLLRNSNYPGRTSPAQRCNRVHPCAGAPGAQSGVEYDAIFGD